MEARTSQKAAEAGMMRNPHIGEPKTLPGWMLSRLRQPDAASSDFKYVGECKISVRQPR
jgi:hypothetical protein